VKRNFAYSLVSLIICFSLGIAYITTFPAGLTPLTSLVFKPIKAYAGQGGVNTIGELATFINRVKNADAETELPVGTYYVSSNYTVPPNIKLRIRKGATINVAKGVILTINCAFEAGLYQVFSGPGNVIFSSNTISAGYPQWWGAKGNGFDDDTAAVQAAVNAASAIFFPPAIYQISHISVSRNNKFISGAYGGSVIRATGTADIFNITGSNIVIENLKFSKSGGARTNGAYIATSGNFIHIHRCFFENGYYGIISCSNLITISDCDFRDFAVKNGICIQINDGYNVYLNRVRMDHNANMMPACGINIKATGDTTISDCNIIHSGVDLLLNPGNGQVVASVYSVNTFYDTANNGIIIWPNSGGAVVRCHFNSCWTSSHNSIGTKINGEVGKIDGINFINHQANLNGSDGVHISNPNALNITFLGGQMAQNVGAGISVSGGASQFFLHNVWASAGFGLKGNIVGIYLDNGCKEYEIVECYCAGNTKGQIVDHSAVGKVINNTGIVTKTSGSNLILIGHTSVVVNHGLMTAPPAGNIIISPTSTWGSNGLYVDITTINATSFTVKCPSPASDNMRFSWQASCCGN
jgi:hypothetical protein